MEQRSGPDRSTTVNFNHTFMSKRAGKITDQYLLAKEVLGEGSYGRVSIGKNKATSQPRAVKTLERSKIPNRTRFEDEIEIQMMLDHPNIVKLYEVFEDFKNVYLVMELCTGGELFDRIVEQAEKQGGGAFPERMAAPYMKQILRAVLYLHSHNFVHRDIKPENFLLDSKDADAEIKVIDFGLAKKYKIGEDPPMKTKAGTPYYVAPQVLQGCYDEKCDIWSSGVIMYILLSGYPPFYGDDDKQILRMVKAGQFDYPSPDWDGISGKAGAKELINRMLTKDPAERFDASSCLAHPWFTTAVSAPETEVKIDLVKNLRSFRGAAKLKKVALTLIATQLPQKEIAELKALFDSMDVDNNGTLTVNEVMDGMKKVGLEIPDEMAIAKMDTDGSGSIDYTEFIAATMDVASYRKKEHIWSAWRVFDEDGDGQVTRDEMVKVLNEVDASKVEQMIAEFDTNGDGKLSFDEFCKMMDA